MWIPSCKPAALARVAGGVDAPCLFGTVKFYQMGENLLVVEEFCGLPHSKTGIFAVHIHEGHSCKGKDFEKTGSHLNPDEQEHPMHAGDLPPLFSCEGKAFLAVLIGRVTLGQIIGRTVVIHSQPDDFYSQPAGNA